MIYKIKRRIIGLIAPKSPLKREVYYLKRAIKKISCAIDHIYDMPFPSCCHGCAYPGLYDLENKLDRQNKRLRELENKIRKNNG